ncbi:FxsA family protein [Balneatrix alpica]|uniref:FxsA family protein n=1 Tax=Balneatrix alpica TaxID=75684 RepID=A0ABV5ZDU6_9GAMM|nr:FxsA family protein [Balneatrix alpica]
MRILIPLFIAMPIIEIALLIQVGQWMGLWPTLGLIVFTAIWGAYMLRTQGLNTLLRAQQRLHHGEIPAQEMLEGIVLAVGGVLLLTPGLVTDSFGLLCMLPGIRKGLIRQLSRRVKVMGGASAQRHAFGQDSASAPQAESWREEIRARPHAQNTLEGDFERKE